MVKKIRVRKIPIMKGGVLVKKVNKLVKRSNAEQHMLNNKSNVTYSAAGAITYLSTIAEGDGNENRSGGKITPDSLDIRMLLNTGAAQGQACRIIVFQDVQTYGAAPAVGDVLHEATVNSQYNVPNMVSKRYRILHDKVYTGVPTDASSLRYIRIKKKSLNTIEYVGNTNAQNAAGRNALYMLRLTSATSNEATDLCSWTLKFHP